MDSLSSAELTGGKKMVYRILLPSFRDSLPISVPHALAYPSHKTRATGFSYPLCPSHLSHVLLLSIVASSYEILWDCASVLQCQWAEKRHWSLQCQWTEKRHWSRQGSVLHLMQRAEKHH